MYKLVFQVCPYSRKVHTTRTGARAVLSIGDTQLVFLDTPGLVDSKEIEKLILIDFDHPNNCQLQCILFVLGITWTKHFQTTL